MTEQEAEALAARLTRIWGPESFGFSANNDFANLSSDFDYTATLRAVLCLEVTFGASHQDALEYFEVSHDGVSLICEDGHISTWENADCKERQEAFASQWLPFFRRGCWLSGCPIKATAHEKAEWIWGFSREEVESWNLKM